MSRNFFFYEETDKNKTKSKNKKGEGGKGKMTFGKRTKLNFLAGKTKKRTTAKVGRAAAGQEAGPLAGCCGVESTCWKFPFT